MTRAKFVCRSVAPAIELDPVVGGSPENDQFFAATPAGYISLSIVNTAAAALFEVGQEYYVDFSRAAPATVPFAPPAGASTSPTGTPAA